MDEQTQAQVDKIRGQMRQVANKLSLNTKSGGGGAEKTYSQLYQQLVQLGAAPQVKKKYRA